MKERPGPENGRVRGTVEEEEQWSVEREREILAEFDETFGRRQRCDDGSRGK